MEIKLFLVHANQLVLVPDKKVGRVVASLGIVEVEIDRGKHFVGGAQNLIGTSG